MKQSLRWAGVTCGIFFLSTAALSGEISFSAKPAITKSGGKTLISFAVSAPTDVEVAILDASGKELRHLAAGMLGGKAPPPEPLKPGLSQTIEWDGKDDLGNAAQSKGVKVRVRANSGVKFGRFIGQNPYVFGKITSIAADEDGDLYAFACTGNCGQDTPTLRVFTPEGKYLRTIMPFPADLKQEAAAAIAAFDADRKAFAPKNRVAGNPAFYFEMYRPGGLPPPALISASKKAGLLMAGDTNFYQLDATGGNFTSKLIFPSKKIVRTTWLTPRIASSPDGRYIYLSNIANLGPYPGPKKPSDIDPNCPQGRIYRMDNTKPGSDPERFYDLELPDWEKTQYWVPDAWNGRSAAAGIAVDAKGNLLICDLVNQEIVEVSPDGRKITATKVPWPETVLVNTDSGDLYVLSRIVNDPGQKTGKPTPNTLLKIVGRGSAAKTVAQITFDRQSFGAMTLSKKDGRSVIWVLRGGALVRIEDRGSSFESFDTELRPSEDIPTDYNKLTVDPTRDEVYISDGTNRLFRFDGNTGQGGLLKKDGKPFQGVDVAVAYDGLLYFRTGINYSGPLGRYTHKLEPAPFTSGSHILSGIIYSRQGIGYCEKGLGVGPRGESYISLMYDWNKYYIAGFDGYGKPIKGKYLENKVGYASDKKACPMWESYPKEMTHGFTGMIPGASGGVRVDLKGNVYIGVRVRPKNFVPPRGYEKDQAYMGWTGSVVKFGPEGGTFLGYPGAESKMPGAPNLTVAGGPADPKELTAENALAVYPGIAPFSGAGFGGGGCCVCRVPRFDVDPYGRLVLPNAVTNSVTLMDNAGNVIFEFGAYGNFDSQFVNPDSKNGKQGKPDMPTPEIPLAWPTAVGISDRFIYVNDVYNKRVVRADLTWGAEAACDIK